MVSIVIPWPLASPIGGIQIGKPYRSNPYIYNTLDQNFQRFFRLLRNVIYIGIWGIYRPIVIPWKTWLYRFRGKIIHHRNKVCQGFLYNGLVTFGAPPGAPRKGKAGRGSNPYQLCEEYKYTTDGCFLTSSLL